MIGRVSPMEPCAIVCRADRAQRQVDALAGLVRGDGVADGCRMDGILVGCRVGSEIRIRAVLTCAAVVSSVFPFRYSLKFFSLRFFLKLVVATDMVNT